MSVASPGELTIEEADCAFPRLAPFRSLTPLHGGSLNYVWRAAREQGSVILKRAPAHVATHPEIPLSARRLLIEARALRLFEPGAPLALLATDAARPPHILGFCRRAWLLAEEDLGDGPDASDVLANRPGFSRLGTFIGLLHRITAGDRRIARRLANPEVQRTRFETQYANVGQFVARAGANDAEALGQVARAVGLRFMEPGRCLVMGDLWPASLLVRSGGFRLIDWELAHYGNPAQDLGHLAAHLTMWGLVRHQRAEASAAISEFLQAYGSELGSLAARLLDEEVLSDASVHFGAELLARVWGPFAQSGPLEGLGTDSATARETTAMALEALRAPSRCAVFLPSSGR